MPPVVEERKLCREYMVRKCHDRTCRWIHDPRYCKLHWEGHCPYGDTCRNLHDFPEANRKDWMRATEEAEKREQEKREAFERALIEKGIDPKSPEAARMLLGGAAARPAVTSGRVDDRDQDSAERARRSQQQGGSDEENEDEMRKPAFITTTRGLRRRLPFDPERNSSDMRIVVDPSPYKLSSAVQVRDVSIHPSIFSQAGDESIYERLVDELSAVAVEQQQALLKPWHNDAHWIADDSTGWKKQSPTFQMILDRIVAYFNMNVNQTRLNWYKDTSEYKPFHHDSAAIKEEAAEVQNFSVGVSFGATRELAFEEVETRRVITMPMPDGYVYAFGRDVNIMWRHGVLRAPEAKKVNEGRISIVLWGWVNQEEVLAPAPPLLPKPLQNADVMKYTDTTA